MTREAWHGSVQYMFCFTSGKPFYRVQIHKIKSTLKKTTGLDFCTCDMDNMIGML